MAEYEKDNGREFGWEDAIENDSPEFILLPDGEYAFEVVDFERGRHGGSEKLPPCNKAMLSVKIEAPEGTVILKHNLFLHSVTEGMLCAFFASIGQRKKGEKATMNWNAVPGARGRCKVGTHKYTNDKGEERTYNDIKRFLEPVEGEPQGGYQAGRF